MKHGDFLLSVLSSEAPGGMWIYKIAEKLPKSAKDPASSARAQDCAASDAQDDTEVHPSPERSAPSEAYEDEAVASSSTGKEAEAVAAGVAEPLQPGVVYAIRQDLD